MEDGAADLIRAADALRETGIASAHMVALLETRWAANRAARLHKRFCDEVGEACGSYPPLNQSHHKKP